MQQGTSAVLLPTAQEFRAKVRRLITPEFADEQAKDLIDLLFCVANPEDERTYELAEAAAHEAYLQTMAFQDSFKAFCELRPIPRPDVDERMLRTGKEM